MHELQTVYESDYKEHINMAQAALDVTKGIKSDQEYRFACDFLLRVREKIRGWSDKFDPRIQQAHQVHKSLIDFKKEIVSPLVKAEDELLKPAILKWERSESDRIRVEQERMNREMKKQEEARRIELAAEMEKSGKKEEAAALIEEPIYTPEVIIAQPESPAGIQSRTLYSAEVVDLKLLCKAVAEGTAPTEYVAANMTVLNSLARNLKESVSPQWEKFGIKVKSQRTLAVGRR